MHHRVDLVNWKNWQPTERAVLCFADAGEKLMLIHKKTGLGKGKINAPGGRIEPGERPLQAAVREVREETGVIVDTLREVCQLHFIFTNGYALHGTVFFAATYRGTPCETPEAKPFWCEKRAIPYDNMWADDILWLPRVLAGKYVKGYFIFDDDTMLDQRVEEFDTIPSEAG